MPVQLWAFICQPSLTPAGVLSLHPYPVTTLFQQSPGELLLKCFFSWGKSYHSHPLCDASRDESSAANFNREMRCFPPRLLTFSNKSLVATVFPLIRRTVIVFMMHPELHQVHLVFFLVPYHQVWLLRCWDGEESLAALQICSYLPFNPTLEYHGFVCLLSVRNFASLWYKFDHD